MEIRVEGINFIVNFLFDFYLWFHEGLRRLVLNAMSTVLYAKRWVHMRMQQMPFAS